MKRRSFLGFLLAVPVAAPVIAKSLTEPAPGKTSFTIEGEVFAVRNISGVPSMSIRGDMIVDGSISAKNISVLRLNAISAEVGAVTSGSLRT